MKSIDSSVSDSVCFRKPLLYCTCHRDPHCLQHEERNEKTARHPPPTQRHQLPNNPCNHPRPRPPPHNPRSECYRLYLNNQKHHPHQSKQMYRSLHKRWTIGPTKHLKKSQIESSTSWCKVYQICPSCCWRSLDLQ
jgi:hypothetical protein